MKVTVSQLPEDKTQFHDCWDNLMQHISMSQTQLLLLPELIFGDWIAVNKNVDLDVKRTNLEDHENWMGKVEAIKDAHVVYSKPVISGDKFHNTAFIWHSDHGHQKLHSKSHFPEAPQFWEGSVYDKEDGSFEVFTIGELKIGVLLCTEMWFTQHARDYGKAGIDLLLCPRATGKASTEQWLRLGQTLSVISGAYCLSSNRSGVDQHDFQWGGTGWITAPINGELLGTTSDDQPFLTLDVDLTISKKAKSEYPLNAIE